ncbi:HAD family hydrolase [Mangrovibacterium marinum]|uniref:D-glycero-alpha-D-manno-heptose-1,7-bisphosphate 7-phosphatase n=1 Tax=Mangrovibacterium marinum TaxID=1639118 RepID=UPI002A188B0A|nr:HAD family hydrolase [Mangrovibacterium marinum]
MSLKDLQIDKRWTLFLDRDGVINQKIDGDYVRNLDQFVVLDGVVEALARLSEVFGRIIVVTNQQGVGKGLMSMPEVEAIHASLSRELEQAGGRIDRFYVAPQLKSANSEFRKPQTGMALAARTDFPEIDFAKSIMVGDSASDIEFGHRLGMVTCLVGNLSASTRADFQLHSLADLPDLILPTANADSN